MSSKSGPEYLDSHGAPGYAKAEFEIIVTYDDVTTIAVAIDKKSDTEIGLGVSKRHKSDARNRQLGHDLAITRALLDVAARYARRAEEAMHPAPDPMREPLRAMKRANKAVQIQRKNEKRRAARERYLRLKSDKHMTRDEISDALGRAFGDWTE